MNWHFSLIYHVAGPKHDLDTMFQYINFIPIHKPMLTLRWIKVIWNYQKNLCFCLQISNTLSKHAYNTDDQLLCNVRNITAKWYWFVSPTVKICSKNTNSGAQIMTYGPWSTFYYADTNNVWRKAKSDIKRDVCSIIFCHWKYHMITFPNI